MRWLSVLVLALLLITPATAYLQTPTDTQASTIPEPAGVDISVRRVIVKLRTPLKADGIPAGSTLASVNQKYNTQLTPLFYPAPRNSDALKLYQSMGMDRLYVATASSDMDTAQAAQAFKASAEVEDAAPDVIGSGENSPLSSLNPLPLPAEGPRGERESSAPPNDPGYSQQWHLPKINALGAWDIGTGSPTITVAIIDTGLWGWHPDLRYRVWYNPIEIPNNGIDDDRNGYVDDNWGWDFVNSDNVPQGDHWHGSHVAGIVGAEVGNGIGVAGLDQHARLMAVKVLDSANRGYYSHWAQGVFYAVENGAQVLNMSLGGTASDIALQTAINYAHSRGAIIVVCMMNENSGTTFYPAGYANTIAVGATDRDDTRASPFHWGGGSNYGNHIDVVAPGNLIYSTQLNDSYLSQSGTSMAAPQVAALAAMIWGVAPGLSNEEVRQVIRQTAVDRVGRAWEDLPGWDPYMGYGRIDAARALTRARELAGRPTPSPTPTLVPPTPTATPTPTTTATIQPPTLTPTPMPGCAMPVVNGGFDGRDGWAITGQRALITGAGHTGSALFLGLLASDTVTHPDGDWASGQQTITLPASFAQLDLTFWAYTGHSGGADAQDRFLARILNPTGQTLVDIPLQVDSAAWQAYRVDLTQALAGQADQPITLYFGVKNVTGVGGNAFMRIDDVALTICQAQAQGTPVLPTPTPTLRSPGPYQLFLPFVGSR